MDLEKARQKAIENKDFIKNAKTIKICEKEKDLTNVPIYRKKFLVGLSKIGTSFNKAVKLHCYECSGYSTTEANNCNCTECALYVLRFNRGKVNIAEKD